MLVLVVKSSEPQICTNANVRPVVDVTEEITFFFFLTSEYACIVHVNDIVN